MSGRGHPFTRQADRAALVVCTGIAMGLLLLPDGAQVRVADTLGALDRKSVV
jgi:hypothetical protein